MAHTHCISRQLCDPGEESLAGPSLGHPWGEANTVIHFIDFVSFYIKCLGE